MAINTVIFEAFTYISDPLSLAPGVYIYLFVLLDITCVCLVREQANVCAVCSNMILLFFCVYKEMSEAFEIQM